MSKAQLMHTFRLLKEEIPMLLVVPDPWIEEQKAGQVPNRE